MKPGIQAIPYRALLLDEMLSPAIAEQLREREWDAQALTEIPGLAGISDDEVLAYATTAHRVVVTRNVRDFIMLDRQWRDLGRTHSGIACLGSQAFRQDRAFVGSVVSALARSMSEGSLPAPGTCGFLSP